MFIQRQNNSSTILPHVTKQALPYIKAEPSSNMLVCYCRIYNFAKSRRRWSWIFLWFAEEEQMRSKIFKGGADVESKKW